MIDNEKHLGENPACKETDLQFGLSGARLEPAKITACFNVNPTKAYAKGEKCGQHERTSGLWIFCTKGAVKSTSPELHADRLLEIFEPKTEEIRTLALSQGLSVRLSIWWEGNSYHGGFTIKSETMNRLTKICDEIDFYFISSEPIEEPDPGSG